MLTEKVHKFMRWLNEAIRSESNWRKDNETNFDFYDGEQWPEDEAVIIEERGQQATVLNLIRPTIDMVLALEINKKIDIQVQGRNKDDDLKARLLTRLLKQISDVSMAEYYESDAFRDGIIGGRGWLMMDVEGEDKEKQIVERHIPWEEVYIDPFHRKPDGSDARFIIRCVWLDRDMVKEMYPKVGAEVDNTFNDEYRGVEHEQQINASDRGLDYYDIESQRVKVCHCWYKNAKGDVKYVVFSDRVILEGSLDNENENKPPLGINDYPLVPFYAFRTHKGAPRGLVRLLRDSQTQINKLNSKFLWNISANRLMIEEGTCDDPDELREEWNRPDGLAVISDGKQGTVRTEDNLRECSFLASHMQFLYGMMQRTSGINDSMLGIGGVNERSATQQHNRILQGASVQTKILSNYHFAKLRLARLAVLLIGEHYTDEVTVRIAYSDGSTEYLQLNQQSINPETGEPEILNEIGDVLQYDVILKKTEAFDSTREKSLQMFAEVAKTGAIPPEIISRIMLEMMDIPNKEDIMHHLGVVQGENQAQAAQQQGLDQAEQMVNIEASLRGSR